MNVSWINSWIIFAPSPSHIFTWNKKATTKPFPPGSNRFAIPQAHLQTGPSPVKPDFLELVFTLQRTPPRVMSSPCFIFLGGMFGGSGMVGCLVRCLLGFFIVAIWKPNHVSECRVCGRHWNHWPVLPKVLGFVCLLAWRKISGSGMSCWWNFRNYEHLCHYAHLL